MSLKSTNKSIGENFTEASYYKDYYIAVPKTKVTLEIWPNFLNVKCFMTELNSLHIYFPMPNIHSAQNVSRWKFMEHKYHSVLMTLPTSILSLLLDSIYFKHQTNYSLSWGPKAALLYSGNLLWHYITNHACSML